VTETRADGKYFPGAAAGEIIASVRAKKYARPALRLRQDPHPPLHRISGAGVAVALRRDGDTLHDLRVAFTGTNPRPVRLAGNAALCGAALDDRVFKGLDALVRDQIMAMKTTFTPGHYRRRVAGVLARRLVMRLFAE